MTVSRIEWAVNSFVGKPLAWLLYIIWLLACLLIHVSRLGLAWLSQRWQSSVPDGASPPARP